MLYGFGTGLLLPLCRLIFHLRFRGLENIPDKGALILCSNHKSVFDPVFLACAVRKSTGRKVRFMAKSELFTDHGKWAARLLLALGAFPVKRGKGDAESIRTAVSLLASGEMVGIFPQGACVFDNSPFRPKAGAVLVAQMAGAPLLPACVYCDGILKPFRRVTVRFGTVLSPEELELFQEGRGALKRASEKMAEQINSLLEEGY